MPIASYSPTKQTLGQILSSTSPPIRVPDYQRDFSWDRKHIEDLWNDLATFDTQFPESAVEGKEYFLGSSVLVNTGTHHLLLDGQQRLATVTILLSAIRDKLQPSNANAAQQIQRDFIVVEDHLAGGSRQYKIQLNVFDRDFFRGFIQDVPRTATSSNKRSHRLIVKARKFFDEQIDELWRSTTPDRAINKLMRLASLLTKHFGLVVISSTDQDHASSIFETLNDRGIGLSTADLLRSWLLTAAPITARDEMIRLWEEVFRSAKKERPEVIIRASWVSRHGDIKARSMYKEIKSSLQAAGVPPLDYTRQLHRDAQLFKQLVCGASGDPVVDEVCRGLTRLKAAGCFSTLIAAGRRGTDELKAMSRAIASLVVRHNIVCRRDPTKLEAKAFEAAQQLSFGRPLDDVLQTLRQLSPSSPDFAASFETISIPPSKNAIAQILLRTIENNRSNTGEKIIASPKHVHIEHIYPQTPPTGTRWNDHDEMVYKLGNLTILAARLNQSIQNAPFEEKKPSYRDSTISITSDLANLGSWDQSSITNRQRQLADEAATIWPSSLT